MWILLIFLSTGQVENLEFSNVESCQHAHNFFLENVEGFTTECYYTPVKSVIIPKEPGKSNEI